MNKTTTALEAALDAAAPDQELWVAGMEAYKASQQEDPGNDEKAYYAALDAAAPDEAAWIKGRDMLVLNGIPLLPAPTLFNRAKNTAKNIVNKDGKKKTKLHWTAKARPVLAFRLLILGLGVLVFLIIQPLIVTAYAGAHNPSAGIIASVVVFVVGFFIGLAVGEVLIRLARNKAHHKPAES